MTATGERGRQVRQLVRAARSGVLSSHSKKFPGFPYGSSLPCASDHAGRIVVLISHLAEHTHNVEQDPRVSFLISESGPDLQSRARATLLGQAQRIEADSTLQARYLRLFPQHAQYLEIGGFAFWQIEPAHIRTIEGFGSMHWLHGDGYLADPGDVPDIETSVLEHMNADHTDAIRVLCVHQHAVDAGHAEMVAFDCDGFDVRADERLLRFSLPHPVRTAEQARAALVTLTRAARDAQ